MEDPRESGPFAIALARPEPPEIVWIGSPNYTVGRYGWAPIALVLHTMEGTLAGCDSWFCNPSADTSAHYGVGLGGETHQYVALKDSAWANGVLEPGNTWPGPSGVNPNQLSVSIETEDNGSGATPVTDAMYNSVLGLGGLVLAEYPSIVYLTTHGCISPQSRPSCSGRSLGRLAPVRRAGGRTRPHAGVLGFWSGFASKIALAIAVGVPSRS